MKKTLTTITLATILAFGSTFANAGIIVAGTPVSGTTCKAELDGIIVAGRVLVGTVFGIIVAGGPSDQTQCYVEIDGIIVAG